jgi:hypothetical protein
MKQIFILTLLGLSLTLPEFALAKNSKCAKAAAKLQRPPRHTFEQGPMARTPARVDRRHDEEDRDTGLWGDGEQVRGFSPGDDPGK